MFKPMNNQVSVYIQEKYSSNIIEINEFTTVSISYDIFDNIKQKIAESNNGIFVLSDYGLIYKKLTINETAYIAISDIGNINYWTRVLWPLIILDVLLLLIFFILSIFLSKISLAPVKEAWVKQKQLVADASHDLKTPFAVIMANNSILQSNKEKLIND